MWKQNQYDQQCISTKVYSFAWTLLSVLYSKSGCTEFHPLSVWCLCTLVSKTCREPLYTRTFIRHTRAMLCAYKTTLLKFSCYSRAITSQVCGFRGISRACSAQRILWQQHGGGFSLSTNKIHPVIQQSVVVLNKKDEAVRSGKGGEYNDPNEYDDQELNIARKWIQHLS